MESNYTVELVTETWCPQGINSNTNTEFPTNITLTQGSFKLTHNSVQYYIYIIRY